jgi:hypothetical protein
MRPISFDTGAATTAPALATMFDGKFHGAPFGHMKAYYISRASDRAAMAEASWPGGRSTLRPAFPDSG